MTTAELDSHKMILVREIINHFNTEESLQKLAEASARKREIHPLMNFPPNYFKN